MREAGNASRTGSACLRPGVRYGPVFSEAMEIPFNQPHQHGPELDYIRDAIQRAHLCGDGYYTKKCHELLAERTGAGKVLLVHSGTAALEMRPC